jgi:hypothetical protein
MERVPVCSVERPTGFVRQIDGAYGILGKVERVVKSVRIASLFSLFSFAIFLRLDQTNFPDSGVPDPLVSTLGFAIFAIENIGGPRRARDLVFGSDRHWASPP